MDKKQYKPVPDVECLKYHGTPEKPDIKIFVSHRIDLDSETIDNPLYIPVRCGAVYDEREGITMLGDDTGDNISEKRNSFCELTVMYWAWKNVKADYYGLCHYRRYLSFSRNQHFLKNSFQLVEEEGITSKSINKYGLDEKSANTLLSKCQPDIILPEEFDIGDINNDVEFSHIRRYEIELGKEFTSKSLKKLFDIIQDKFPTYLTAAKEYYFGKTAYFCNCFIMKNELFQHYCKWLFDILFELEKDIDFTNLSEKETRIVGFFSEDLLSIYVKTNLCKARKKELQLVYFRDTTAKPALQPAFKNNSVTIVLSSDDVYSVYMGVLIQSIIEHSSSKNNYDIIVLHTDISERNRFLINSIVSGRKNFSVRFTNISFEMGSREFQVWAHYKKYNVYRLVAPEVLRNFDKAIYLDSDIVLNTDVAELFYIDISKYLVAAVPDIRFASWAGTEGNALQKYAKKILKLSETHQYFNSGVLVYNLKEFRENCSSDYMLSICEQRKWQYIDQDVLNIVCDGQTYYLPMKWNVMITADNNLTEKRAPFQLFQEYLAAHKDPYIVHYAGDFLPIKHPTVDLYWYFWKSARQTPFYEMLIHQMVDNKIMAITPCATIAPPFDGRSGARKIADVILPKGTRRRKFAKILLPKGSLRWRFCKQIYYIFRPEYRPSK